MSGGDALDLLTPLVLLPLHWRLFRIAPDHPPSGRQVLLFVVLAALWAEGQGMHLLATRSGGSPRTWRTGRPASSPTSTTKA